MALRRVRIAGVPEPYNLPWHLAMEKGAFKEAGIELEWHTVHEGTGRMCRMLREGELDMAVLVTEGAAADILNGGPIRIVSTFVESPLPWGVHVPAGSALRAPADLMQVPYAISRRGSGSQIMAMLHAESLGWRPEERDLEVVHNMAGAAARMSEGSPIIFLWEQFVTARYVDAGVMRCVDVVRGDWPGFVIVAREDYIREQAATMEAVLVLLAREVADLRTGPHVVELVMQNAGFSEERAREWLEGVEWRLDQPSYLRLSALVGTLQALKLVPSEKAQGS
ncbi:MAG: ABC transporter substrate-binding protein [Flavobacteriales bacterium]|jgi:ABC-type nitrate/sulfonate/bicarbonate transport system substrate-binding protein|nr:ABC transporter substrate-binding protein [Flavobacteriales bacterium]